MSADDAAAGRPGAPGRPQVRRRTETRRADAGRLPRDGATELSAGDTGTAASRGNVARPASPATPGSAKGLRTAHGQGLAGEGSPANTDSTATDSTATGFAATESAASGSAGASGPELARAVLDAAKARRQAARTPRRPRSGGGAEPRRRGGYTGPGADPRDPQPFGAVLHRLLAYRGWQRPAAEATVLGAWDRVVGPDIAQHSRPLRLADGELTVEAESTAWATQLRLLQSTLLRNIAREVGHGVVTRMRIHGPAAPSWHRGPLRVRGRGPGDTYG